MPATTIRPAILVVEDEPLVRMSAASVLEDGGYEVVEAANAEQALVQLEQRPDIELVFSDINMPGQMDGCALARTIIAGRPGVRIVLTSGKRIPDDGSCPANSVFVPKPYRAERVLALLNQIHRQ